MIRGGLVMLSVLALLRAAVFAEGLKLEKTIDLPEGVNVSYTVVSPAGNFIAAVCGDQKLRIFDAGSGSLSQSLDLGGQRISSARISPDGKLLAAGGRNGAVRIWEVSSGRLRLEFTSPGSVDAVSISAGGNLVAVAPAEQAVEIWDINQAKRMASMRAPFSGTSALAFSPDGHWLATADGDTNVRIYDARTGTLRTTVEDMLLEEFAVSFSADGRSIITGGADKTVYVIDATTGKILRSLAKQPDPIIDLRVSPDGKLVAAAYMNADDLRKPAPVIVWDIEKQQALSRVLEPDIRPNGGEFVPDGRLLMTSGAAKELKLWSLQ